MKSIGSLFAGLVLCGTSLAQITLNSGYQSGSYYSIAQDIKDLMGQRMIIDTVEIDEDKERYDTTYYSDVRVRTSEGSVQNYRKVLKSEGDQVAFVQQDVIFFNEYKDLEKNTNYTENIKYLLALGAEHVHLITKKDSEINSLADLEKKKVGIGSKNQGTQFTAKQIKKLTGISWVDNETPVQQCFAALLNDEIDAFFMVGAVPITKLDMMSREMRLHFKLVPIQDERLNGDYIEMKFTKGDYPWVEEDIVTVGTRLFLVHNDSRTSDKTKKLLQKMLSKIYENREELMANAHPIFEDMSFSFEHVNQRRVSPLAQKAFGM